MSHSFGIVGFSFNQREEEKEKTELWVARKGVS